MGDSAQADPSANFYPGDKLVRIRALAVAPDVNTSNWTGACKGAGCDADIFATVVPELDLTYFLTSNLAVEVIAGVVPVSVKGKGAIVHDSTIGDAWLLPPTVTLQYHLGNVAGINPYVGAGVNYTVFFNKHAGDYTTFKVDNAWGLALQAGFDMPLGNNLFLNVDVKKIFLDTDASVANGTISTKVDIDPWLVGVGVGYRLGGNRAPLK